MFEFLSSRREGRALPVLGKPEPRAPDVMSSRRPSQEAISIQVQGAASVVISSLELAAALTRSTSTLVAFPTHYPPRSALAPEIWLRRTRLRRKSETARLLRH